MKISRSKIFLFCLVGFIFGIAVASFLPTRIIEKDLLWFVGMMLFFVITVLFRNNKTFKIIALIGLFLFLGIWRYSLSIPNNTPDKIWHYNGQTITFRGVIASEPDVREFNQKLTVNSKQLIANSKKFSVSGKVLVTTKLFPDYEYGDSVIFTCELEKPERFSGFSYDRYLERFNIFSVCYYPSFVDMGQKNLTPTLSLVRRGGNWFYGKVFEFKNKLRGLIEYGLGEPEAGLAKAIILGDKKGIPSDLRDKFSKAGLSHIVAISGMHISILSALVMSGLLALGIARKRSFYIGVLFLILYIFLIGLPASAMRAGLMGFLVLLAMQLGRLNKLTNSLVLAGVILLLINPRLLRDDIGFQLSFLAVLGIAYIYPLFDTLYKKFEEWINNKKNVFLSNKVFLKIVKIIFGIFGITLAAQVFTLPIMAVNFSMISIIAPISNLLILWTLPLLMIAVLLGLLLSMVLPAFGVVWFLPASLFLKYIVYVTEVSVKLPYAYVEVDYLWWVWVVLYYVVVVWGVVWLRKRNV